MKADELARLVQQMRDTQKRYFSLRRAGGREDEIAQTLSHAKELERRVDQAVDNVLNKQGRLF